MMNNELNNILLQKLDYAESPGFNAPISWLNERPIPDIYSIYSIQNVPIIYFSQLNEADPERLWKLYRHVWSQSKVPLLYVFLPQEIRIYNSYVEPPETPEELDKGKGLLRILQRLVDVESTRQKIRSQLNGYNRLSLETGAFWSTPDGQSIKRERRADQRLLNSMDQARQRLIDQNLSPNKAYTLLGRSIFIRYLEDRGILPADTISELAGESVQNYRSLTGLNKKGVAQKTL